MRAPRWTVPLLSVLIVGATACGADGGAGSASGPGGTAGSYGTCAVTSSRGSIKLTTVTADTLTVGVILPNPGNFDGPSPESIRSGFEYCLAAEIANAAGLPRLRLVNVAFEGLVAGQVRDYDLAMSGIFITDERKKTVDFSAPYYTTTSAFLVKRDSTFDETAARRASIAVYNGSVQQRWLTGNLPTASARPFPGTAEMVAAVTAGQVDAALLDTPLMLTAAQKSNGALKVVARIDVGGDSGAVMPKGSPNKAAVDATIATLKSAGTLDKLATTYLVPAFGGNPDDLPAWSL